MGHSRSWVLVCPPRSNLVSRIVGSLLLVSLVVLALVGAYAVSRARDSLKSQVYQRLDAAASLRQTFFDERVDDTLAAVRNVAESPQLSEQIEQMQGPPSRKTAAARVRAAEILRRAIRHQSDLSELFVMSPTGGRVMVATDRDHEGRYEVAEPFFQVGLKRADVLGIYPSASDGAPAMTAVSPLRDADGRRIAVIGGHVDLNRLRTVLLDRRGLGRTGETYFVDRFNNFVSPARFGERSFPRGVRTPGVNRALGGANGRGLYENYSGVPVVGAYRWLENRNVALLAEVRQDEAFAPERRLTQAILIGGVLAAMVLAAITYLLTRRIVRPVRSLTTAASALADGDLGRTAPVSGRDEVGTLGHAFNRMSSELLETHEDLERRVDDLAASEERYALAQRGANDGLWDWDLERDELYVSSRWASMIGYDEEELGSSPSEWLDRIHPDDRKRVRSDFDRHLAGEIPHFEAEFRIRHRDGRWLWVLARGVAVRDGDAPPHRCAGSLTDISDRKAFEDQLLRQALHDPLTGLANRALFMERLDHLLRRSSRHPDDGFAVLFVDVDQFKVVNDSLGHLAGDELLISVARRLASGLRPGDTIARLGGDEFAILLEPVEGARDVLHTAERVQQRLNSPLTLAERELFITASIGIAFGPRRYRASEEILRDADTAMYRAKSLGRGRHALFDEDMHLRALNRLAVESDLRRAVERDEFEVLFQPIVSLDDQRVVAVEALARWLHPERGLLSPAEFIPVAEETGLIVPLGRLVLQRIVATLGDWRRELGPERVPRVSVNVSRVQLRHPDFVASVRELVADPQVASHLNLEITESVVVQDAATEGRALDDLVDLGLHLHVDDFGTGYSSLATLHEMPISTLKIDRSFITGLGGRRDTTEVIRAIVALGHNLDMEIVAEGIETEEQLAAIQALGCDLGQGYLFARPLPAGHLMDRLHQEV
ncbi:EAL domain-containing protein [Svornostia abyssi]|uniref:EAL domain-containing protein n=1 Tax=Svornostia abyssi TaxID=2898438 RepID=A0ABY5PD48_9ACTN|nr:EAL domain-containing protein [Parviterribacteraceae bacterium J379]